MYEIFGSYSRSRSAIYWQKQAYQDIVKKLYTTYHSLSYAEEIQVNELAAKRVASDLQALHTTVCHLLKQKPFNPHWGPSLIEAEILANEPSIHLLTQISLPPELDKQVALLKKRYDKEVGEETFRLSTEKATESITIEKADLFGIIQDIDLEQSVVWIDDKYQHESYILYAILEYLYQTKPLPNLPKKEDVLYIFSKLTTDTIKQMATVAGINLKELVYFLSSLKPVALDLRETNDAKFIIIDDNNAIAPDTFALEHENYCCNLLEKYTVDLQNQDITIT